jgi:hypothetical protein
MEKIIKRSLDSDLHVTYIYMVEPRLNFPLHLEQNARIIGFSRSNQTIPLSLFRPEKSIVTVTRLNSKLLNYVGSTAKIRGYSDSPSRESRQGRKQ